jgi:hypothetical protein
VNFAEDDEEITDEEDDSSTDGVGKVLGVDDEIFLLKDYPEKPEPILCLGTSSSKNWEYKFPDLVEKDCHVSFWNAAMNKMLKFDSRSMTLTII